MLSNNSNTDQSDFDENSHAGRYPVHEILWKRAHTRGRNKAFLAPHEVQQRGIHCLGGQQGHDGFDDGHTQQVRRGIQQGRRGDQQARHGGGYGHGQGIQQS